MIRAEEEAETPQSVVKQRCAPSTVPRVPELEKPEKLGLNATLHQLERQGGVRAEQCIADLDWSLRLLVAAHIVEAEA